MKNIEYLEKLKLSMDNLYQQKLLKVEDYDDFIRFYNFVIELNKKNG